jgi:putative ABC transport system permease protein
MRRWRAFFIRLAATLGGLGGLGGRRRRELAAEIESHLAMHVDDNLRLGMSPAAARRQARMKLGSIEALTESYRDRRGLPLLARLLQDTGYALRTLARNPAFAAFAVLTLALGVGANTALFSVVNAMFLRPLPYLHSEQLVVLREAADGYQGFVAPDLVDFQAASRSLTGIAGFIPEPTNFGTGQRADEIRAAYVTAGFFSTLGIAPQQGRAFVPAEDQPGGRRIALISAELWRQRLGGAPDVVGRTILLDGRACQIAGVMPAGFRFYGRQDVWLPFGLWPYDRQSRDDFHSSLLAVARLRPGVALHAAQLEMDAVARRLAAEYPRTNTHRGAVVAALQQDMVGDLRPAVLLLFIAVAVVLLIGCVNLAGMLLARGTSRQKELVVRAALGAGRSRLIQQLMTESLVLALLGGGLGLLLAACTRSLVVVAAAGPARSADVPIDGFVLAFALAATLAAALLVGLMPALRATRVVAARALGGAGRHTAGAGRQRLLNSLVVAEIALALVLLAGAGLLLKSVALLRSVDPGFPTDGLLAMNLSMPRHAYNREETKTLFLRRALDRLAALPGVESAAAVFLLPVNAKSWGVRYAPGGRQEPEPTQAAIATTSSISPGYFATMRLPLLAGRDFSDADTATRPAVVIIDATLARRAWPGADPVGRQLRFMQPGEPPRTIVGVARAVHNAGLARPPQPQAYVPYTQKIAGMNVVPFAQMVVRAAGAPAGLAAAIRRAVAEADPGVAVTSLQTMDFLLDDAVAQRRLPAALLGLFAALALLLAAIGIYAVMAHAVGQRTHEIGLRMALGAARRDVLGLIAWRGLRLLALGLGLGLVAAFLLTSLLDAMLFHTTSRDPLTLLSASLILAAAAALACYLPARRASAVDPMAALRCD